MRISKIDQTTNTFKQQDSSEQKPEFIDKFSQAIRNPRDVNDCVAVPRGIFKAYLFIMGGFALLSIGLALPQKWQAAKTTLAILGNMLNFTSAIFFAKGFAVKGVSPTINRDEFIAKRG